METKRFRNHFSIIVERMGTALVTLVLILMANVDDIAQSAVEEDGSIIILLLVVGGVLLLMCIIFGIQILQWSRTWIAIDEDAITIEINTINRSKNTIGIKNISNVNIEQNLFEMIMGTCKLKLDTDTLTTANTTDVLIVLKKQQAEEVRKHLVKRINEINNGIKQEEEVADFDDDNEEYDVVAETKDMLFNGLYSMSIISIIVMIASIGAIVFTIADAIRNGISAGSVGGMLGSVFAIGVLFVSSATSLVKAFLNMYGFKVKRDGSRLYIKYGLFKKVNFAIPVDKINAIQIHQTLIARIFKKYTAEMINVGMGDEENSSAYFTFYGSKQKLQNAIDTLLPEFSEAVSAKFERQPKVVWVKKILGILEMSIIFIAIAFGVLQLVEENEKSIAIIVLTGIILCIILLMIVSHILTYFCCGTSISKNYLGLQEGCFATCRTIIKFDKVQYVTFNQGLLEKKLGIIHGNANILAMLGKNLQTIPYIKEEKVEEIKNNLIDWRN